MEDEDVSSRIQGWKSRRSDGGVSREHQILKDYTSMQTKIPAEF
jgi:hypothetical protein